jgi:DNA invertase Pin-like site-specific DNA recombinase
LTDAYIYIRFSTVRQEDGSSYERQLDACRQFVRRKGWNEVGLIEDLGKSAWKGDHLTKGNLGKFAKRILDGEIPAGTVVVAENIDRFSRQRARVTQRWIEDVCDKGIKLATVAGEKVYDAVNLDDNIASIMEVLLLAEGAYRYVQNLQTRVKGSYEARLKQARIDNTAIGGIGPAWLEKVGERPNIQWVPIPERVKLIREMFDLTCAGQAPWAIARLLNARGERSFTGIEWERTSVVKILRNRAIEGDYVVGEGKTQVPTGEVLFGYYGEPIVPLDVIKQAREMLDGRRRGSGRNSGAVNNLFGQKIRCGECGGRMMQVGYQSRYLVCYEANRSNGCSHKTSYKYRPFEAAALDEILHLALDERFFRHAKKSNALGLDIAATEKAICDRQDEVQRLTDTLTRIASPTVEAKIAKLEAAIAELKGTLGKLNDELTLAQGAASAEAHLERVFAVREALSHPQDDVRLPARLRVSAALRDIIDGIACAHHRVDGEKVFTMTALGGAHAVVLDNEGGLRVRFQPSVEQDWAEFVDERFANASGLKVESYFRRRRAADAK